VWRKFWVGGFGRFFLRVGGLFFFKMWRREDEGMGLREKGRGGLINGVCY